MSDHTTADEIAETLQATAGELSERFHADRYTILRTTRPDLGDGAWLSVVVAEVESGRCALVSGSASSAPTPSGEVWVTISPASVELPRATQLKTTDRIRINGRTYEVDGEQPISEFDPFRTFGITEVQP
jgi:hypothetical protein